MSNIKNIMWIEKFLAYMKKFDPQFRSKIRGANEKDIQEMETSLGVLLPEVYREYMETMGQNDGGLFKSSRARTDVTAVLEMIKIIREERPDVDFKNFIPIASCDNIEGWALTQKEGEWQVVTIDHNLPAKYVANSLPDLVFYTAFGERVRLAPHQVRFTIRNSKINLDDIKKQASSMDFVAESFCDHLSYFGTKSDILLVVHTGIVGGFDGFVASDDLNIAKQEANHLIKIFKGTISNIK